MPSTDTSEKGLETLIVESLVTQAGYVQGRSEDHDRDHAVDPAQFLTFLSATRPKVVEPLDLEEDIDDDKIQGDDEPELVEEAIED